MLTLRKMLLNKHTNSFWEEKILRMMLKLYLQQCFVLLQTSHAKIKSLFKKKTYVIAQQKKKQATYNYL